MKILNILTNKNCPNIVQLMDKKESLEPKQNQSIMEYCEYDLTGLLKTRRLTPDHVRCYFRQLITGLESCHSTHIIHCDVKPGNILVHPNNLVKLADFGVAVIYSGETVSQYNGTFEYQPPEVLLCSNRYDYSVDIWAAGCVLFKMITGETLFKAPHNME
jgi:serine/threonine protein kinase